MENNEVSKKRRPGKLKLIIIIFVIIMLIITLSLLYFNNATFKSKADNLFKKLPGNGNRNTSSSFTDSELNTMKEDLAGYYLSLEPDVAADKLYIVKNDDETLYSDVIKLMNSRSSSKTAQIITLIRNIENREGSLISIYEEVKEKNQNSLLEKTSRLENQDLLMTINEIESGTISGVDLSAIFTNMSEEKAADILYYIDEEIREQILYSIKGDKRSSINSEILSKSNQIIRLTNSASLYETKPIEISLKEIGNTETYSIDELGVIYNNLSVLKSAEILSKIEDDSFIQELFVAIRKDEQLNGEQSTTDDISKAIQFISEYNNKIDNLVNVYEDMDSNKIAEIVEQMINNDTTVTAFEINSEPIFEISDASIIIDVLSRIKDKTLSEIINDLSTENASMLTQMLARP
ncbi:hypothetical protein K8M07_01225 [Schnuerera sp. xch1]|uniref:hypothetical protein n=1 Tax=Schnuerera sp. xch1 TaxID=2874283 RepID=UPI001CC04108|nr:hypothetical protein [Schnuerera sp. xch1]MBZ2173874.1 hypothetical protein [Schnuerera sp. xch1]